MRLQRASCRDGKCVRRHDVRFHFELPVPVASERLSFVCAHLPTESLSRQSSLGRTHRLGDWVRARLIEANTISGGLIFQLTDWNDDGTTNGEGRGKTRRLGRVKGRKRSRK